ncbi:PREDICTED: uncharacterized protein LOC106819955, partial [Priapulus caudatus]|uniref:Uncharacterized protein LOC106819955 n=1 Tax=Priapulus caudatus TaxID=37621 RepID=A0ABM1F6D4_PRICU
MDDCFSPLKNKTTWTLAREQCREAGGRIATPSDARTELHLRYHVQDGDPGTWIGLLSEPGRNGSTGYSWVDMSGGSSAVPFHRFSNSSWRRTQLETDVCALVPASPIVPWEFAGSCLSTDYYYACQHSAVKPPGDPGTWIGLLSEPGRNGSTGYSWVDMSGGSSAVPFHRFSNSIIEDQLETDVCAFVSASPIVPWEFAGSCLSTDYYYACQHSAVKPPDALLHLYVDMGSPTPSAAADAPIVHITARDFMHESIEISPRITCSFRHAHREFPIKWVKDGLEIDQPNPPPGVTVVSEALLSIVRTNKLVCWRISQKGGSSGVLSIPE